VDPICDLDNFEIGGVGQTVDFAVEQMEALGEEPDPKWHQFLEVLLKVDSLQD